MAQLIAHAGAPRIHLAWTQPEKDPDLQRALRAHRLVTIHQHTRGSRKDHAVVGLEPGRRRQFLIFDKPLRRFEGAHIVGIRYADLGEGVSLGPVPPPRKRTPLRTVKHAPATTPHGPPDNLIRFERAPPPSSPKPHRPVRASRVEGTARPGRDKRTTTLTKEITAAADDLRAGRIEVARRRLQSVLLAIGGST